MATPIYDENDSAQGALIDRVEYRSDQVTAAGQTIGLNRQSVYDEMVEAARGILRKAPMALTLEASSDGTSADTSVTNAYTLVECPDDYIRFLSLKLSGWKRPVYELTDPRTNLYRLQFNTRAASDSYNPVAVITPNSAPSGMNSGKQAIQAFPKDDPPTVEQFEYIGTTAPEVIPDELVDAMLWETTGRALQAQKGEGAGAAYELAQQSINNLRVGLRNEEIQSE